MKLNVFGEIIEVIRSNDNWQAFYLGNEGKRRQARDIVIPSDLAETDIAEYLADLRHERASPKNNSVKVL